MATTRPRLSDDDRTVLRELGVTAAQIVLLDRRLPLFARRLSAAPPNKGVRDVLMRAKAAADELVRIADAAEAGRPAAASAYALIGMGAVAAPSEPADGSGEGLLPEVLDFASLARALRAMTAQAFEDAPKGQRRGRADPAGAVQLLMDTLRQPTDEASRALAQRCAPAVAETKTNPFVVVATTVFGCAVGKSAIDLDAPCKAWRQMNARRSEASGSRRQGPKKAT